MTTTAAAVPGHKWNTRYANKRAGYSWTPVGGKTHYWVIRIFDWPFYAHRLAILYVTGEWPPITVDHADRNGLNNKLSNIRLASRAENMANCGAFKNSKTGLRGVSFHKRVNKYRATITINGRQLFLGNFDNPRLAYAAYQQAARAAFGKFARSE